MNITSPSCQSIDSIHNRCMAHRSVCSRIDTLLSLSVWMERTWFEIANVLTRGKLVIRFGIIPVIFPNTNTLITTAFFILHELHTKIKEEKNTHSRYYFEYNNSCTFETADKVCQFVTLAWVQIGTVTIFVNYILW